MSVVMHRGLAPVLGTLFLDIGEVLIEHDAALARERNKALAARTADKRQVCLARKLHAPGGEARARDQNRNAHAYALDHHLGSKSSCCVEDLVGSGNAILKHPA